MKPALLDVNVLIALLDPSHEFHDRAHAWFELNRQHKWATCPITQNACLRILRKPSYPYPGLSVRRIRNILHELCTSTDHIFWTDSVSILDGSRFDLSAAAPGNLTDLYLLGLAVAHNGRIATFDRNIRWHNVSGAVSGSVEQLLPAH